MKLEAGRWAIVLGAGDGTRLEALTRQRGVAVPKQYCSLDGERSLLQLALGRAERLVSRERIVTVVAERHRDWWEEDLAGFPARNVVVQPMNRGTAAGVLLPLIQVARRDPRARVVMFPSDHWVDAEWVLSDAVGAAFELLERDPGRVILLGVSPDRPEPGYGWILPGAPRWSAAGTSLHDVASFVEKPAPELARQLLPLGGLWNSFILVGTAEALLDLYNRRMPDLLERMADATADPTGSALDELYSDLEPRDFSRDLMQGGEHGLYVAHVPPCGWTDLGTPLRVAECLRRLSPAPAVAVPFDVHPHRVNLSWALAGQA